METIDFRFSTRVHRRAPVAGIRATGATPKYKGYSTPITSSNAFYLVPVTIPTTSGKIIAVYQ
jgi:hypothetical protein